MKPIGSNTHKTPSIAQGTMADSQGAAAGAPVDVLRKPTEQPMSVAVVASQGTKLRLAPGVLPSAAQLFIPTDNGTHVEAAQGTVEQPNIRSRMVEDCLFIDGTPQPGDVRQGYLNDCYFLAALLGVIHADPGHLTSMMSSAGGQVTTQFFRWAQKAWTEQRITTSHMLQTRNDGELEGASFRIASRPKESLWFAEIESSVLRVVREDRYECAMWAPMIEKSYAHFAEAFGKYGGGDTGVNGSGYTLINAGGESQLCYGLFYGNKLTSKGTSNVQFEATSKLGIVMQNRDALTQLIAFHEAKHDRRGAAHRNMFLSAKIDRTSAAARCVALIQRVLDRDDVALHERASGLGLADALRSLQRAASKFVQSSSVSKSLKSSYDSQPLADAARPVQAPGAYPAMWTTDPVYVELRENLGILVNFGDDKGPGRRTLRSSHAYNVCDLTFMDYAGRRMNMTSRKVDELMPQISPIGSTVVLENPYADFEWDERGTGAPDGVNDGRFTLTLDQFLRNTALLRTATAMPNPIEGP